MKTPIRNFAIACAAIGSLASLQAADITQTSNNAIGSNWNAAIWGGGNAPVAGNNYFSASGLAGASTAFTTNGQTWIATSIVRDNESALTFAGDSLTMVANTRLLGKVRNGSTSTVNLVFGGGFYFSGVDPGNGSAILDGSISFASGIDLGAIALNPNGSAGTGGTLTMALTVSSMVLGDSSDTLQLTLLSEGAGVNAGTRLGQLIFNGDITGFGGTLYVGTATNGTNANSFYSIQSSSVSTTLQLDYAVGNNFRYNLATDETFGAVQLGASFLAPGTYNAAALNALTTLRIGDEFFGTGTITVVPEPSTYALGMLSLLALAALMRRKRNV